MNRYAKLCHSMAGRAEKLVGAVGFEPTTPTPPELRATAKPLIYKDGSAFLGAIRSFIVSHRFNECVPKLCPTPLQERQA